jgi:hypothetical protein
MLCAGAVTTACALQPDSCSFSGVAALFMLRCERLVGLIHDVCTVDD